MSSSICSFPIMCPSDTSSSLNSLDDAGKIIGIAIGSLLALAFLICIVIIIYLIFCKRKPRVQVWAQSYPRRQTYGQSMMIFPYTNYPQGSMQQLQPDPQRIIEELPPAYEEINTIENSSTKL